MQWLNRLREHIGRTGWWWVAAAWLVTLSALSVSHGLAGLQPLNAITGTPIDAGAARLEFKWYAIAFEPLFALAQMVIGAPDYRMSPLTWLVWIAVIVWILAYAVVFRGEAGAFRRLWNTTIVVAQAVSICVAYFVLLTTLHIPLWRLVADDPQVVALDLHSHTLASDDGIATLADTNAYHAGNGYAIFAITDHQSASAPIWSSADAKATRGAALIFGVEISIAQNHDKNLFVVLLSAEKDGISSYVPPEWRPGENNLKAAIGEAHRRGLATIAVAYKLTPADVAELAAADVDGFEIANFGHPDMSQEAQAAIRAIYELKGRVVVADTDWHGWSGVSRTWTLYHWNDREEHSTTAIVDALKRRDAPAFTPVVSRPFASIPPLRAMLSPLFDVWRYGTELSPLRLLSWWTWAVLLLVAHRYAGERSRAVMRVATRRLGDILGLALVFRGGTLLATGVSDAHSFVVDAGLWTLCAGFWLLAVWRMQPRTTRKAVPGPDMLPGGLTRSLH